MSDLNDPRVLFAAERTLLSWHRTAVTLMGLGFVIERFGLFLHLLGKAQHPLQRGISFWLGIAFIALGIVLAASSIRQYKAVLASLGPNEFPAGYWRHNGIVANVILIILGILTLAYLAHGLM